MVKAKFDGRHGSLVDYPYRAHCHVRVEGVSMPRSAGRAFRRLDDQAGHRTFEIRRTERSHESTVPTVPVVPGPEGVDLRHRSVGAESAPIDQFFSGEPAKHPATGWPGEPRPLWQRPTFMKVGRMGVIVVMAVAALVACGEDDESASTARNVDKTAATDPAWPDEVPDGPPTVTGVVGTDGEGRPGVLDNPSEEEYARINLTTGNPVVFDLASGEKVPFDSLEGGERIELWIPRGCGESIPLHCEVSAIGVHRER